MIHLIGFYTQGHPFDSARDLSESKKKFQLLYETQVDQLKLYNTTYMMVKNAKFKDYIEPLPRYKFLDGWTHQFCRWKPFVIYEHLKAMNDEDILVYHDCDILKNREYEKGVSQFRENVNKVLDNTDLACGMDSLYRNKFSTKEDVFQQFGDFRETRTLRTNRIFIRKNTKTLQFIYNWLTLCDTSLFLPNFTEKHSYSESLFNMLYYKYIELGEFSYPTVYFKNNQFSSEMIQFLDKPNEMFKVVETKKVDFSYSPSLFETTTTVPRPLRRMLPPHQSTRSTAMSLIPIAKPAGFIRRPPPLFTLGKKSL
jgi:hypothetical protein